MPRLFALHDAVDHGLLLLAQVLDFGVNPFIDVVDTPADLHVPSELHGRVIPFGERDFHLGGKLFYGLNELGIAQYLVENALLVPREICHAASKY